MGPPPRSRLLCLGGIPDALCLRPDSPSQMAAAGPLHDLLQDTLAHRRRLPVWRVHALAGSPADGLAHAFIGAPVMILFVPWRYVFENCIYKRKEKRT